jgi:hypothetical protein
MHNENIPIRINRARFFINRIYHCKIIPVLTFLKALIAGKQRYKNEIRRLLLEK